MKPMLGLIVVVLALAACTSAPATDTPTVQPPPTSTVAPTVAPSATSTVEPTSTETPEPSATPTIAVTATDTQIPATQTESGFPTGKFLDPREEGVYFLFDDKGRWSHWSEGTRLASGSYSVEGDIYTQTKLDGRGECPPMTFKYTFDGVWLRFQLTDESKNDPCPERADNYNNRQFRLEP